MSRNASKHPEAYRKQVRNRMSVLRRIHSLAFWTWLASCKSGADGPKETSAAASRVAVRLPRTGHRRRHATFWVVKPKSLTAQTTVYVLLLGAAQLRLNYLIA